MGMKYLEISLKMPTDYREEELRRELERTLGTGNFTYQLESKSLDARKKNNIHWLVKAVVLSEEIKGDEPVECPRLAIPYRRRGEQAVVVGSGPAGFFAALVLQRAGFKTVILERGSEVGQRAEGIGTFEQTGRFDPLANYAFGEGGAGTFSDGKLTSRSKHISMEKRFILASYIQAGAPGEIWYMAHPHLGSDHLKKIVRNLRDEFLSIGGTVLFKTFMEDLTIRNGRVVEAKTNAGSIPGDFFIMAPGHSAYETYRMLIRRGVQFRTKNFALGCRVEHPQELVNLAQWGRTALPGVKAAEYRLTSKADGLLPVYTFCMCPGGVIVPATAYPDRNIVNGMSLYQRDGRFANAACVAGVNLETLLGHTAEPLEALDWLENLEGVFHQYARGFRAPFCGIRNFIEADESSAPVETSYPLGLAPAALWELLPAPVSRALREGLKDFNRKMKGFATGIIMGLESKTSAPIRVLRDEHHLCQGFENLYLVGEGSGHSGGIISSAADGIKSAMKLVGAAGV
jgi:hypothetical protein